jgi:replication factor C subunit 3/5
LELYPSDAGNNDRIILSQLFKEYGTSNSMAFSSANNFFTVKDQNSRSDLVEKKNSFFTFVIHDAEKLSQGAFAALRRTLEKYSSQVKVIMVCKSLGNIIPAIK